MVGSEIRKQVPWAGQRRVTLILQCRRATAQIAQRILRVTQQSEASFTHAPILKSPAAREVLLVLTVASAAAPLAAKRISTRGRVLALMPSSASVSVLLAKHLRWFQIRPRYGKT